MATRRTLPPTLATLVAALGLAGCGPQFDPQATIDTLRVLAVQKDRPYAAPGDDVHFKMLWSDGSSDAGRPVETAWLSGCINPLGDLYAGCFAPGQFEPDPDTELPPFTLGDELTFTVPDDIITSRPPPPDPRQPRYGLSYVFFVACAGTLRASGSSDFPLRCLDSDGRALGSKDFVAGYTALYVYDDFGNNNPIVRGLSLDGKPLDSVCVDPASAAAFASGELGAVLGRAAEGAGSPGASEPPVVCESNLPVDPADEPDCTLPNAPCFFRPIPAFVHLPLEIRPEVYRASIEPDSISEVAYGRDYEEQMWINYYVSKGELLSDVRLLNDATTGLNEEFATLYYPSYEPGPITLWAVVHDNRGGVAWARGTLWVK
jgi:hypothetical protein